MEIVIADAPLNATHASNNKWMTYEKVRSRGWRAHYGIFSNNASRPAATVSKSSGCSAGQAKANPNSQFALVSWMYSM